MDALTDEEIALKLAAEWRAAPPIRFETNAAGAYVLVGLLQLALRDPSIGLGDPRVRAMVDEVVRQLSAIGPVTAMTLQWGFDRAFDRRARMTNRRGGDDCI